MVRTLLRIYACSFLLFITFFTFGQGSIEADLDSVDKYLNEGEFTPAYLFSIKATMALDKLKIDDTEFKYNAYKKFIKSINYGIQRMSSPYSRLTFYKAEYNTYETTIGLAFELYQKTNDNQYLIEAFELVERNRNVLFLQSIKGNENLNFGGVPDSILIQESIYIADIKQVNDSLSFYKKRITSHSKKIIDRLELEKDELTASFKAFREKNQKQYQNFNALIERNRIISIPDIQQKLKPEQAFIEYFYGDRHIYAFVFTKNNIHFARVASTSMVKQLIIDFKRSNHHDEKQFVNISYKLFKTLFQPLTGYLNDIKKITLIADGALSYLPFEAFLTAAPKKWDYNFSTLPYLIYKYQFAYHQSATSYLNIKTIKLQKGKALALAPLFTDAVKNHIAGNDSLYNLLNPLLASQQLLKHLQGYYSTQLLTGIQATKRNFLKYQQAPLLHFATHTLVNDIAPLESRIALARSDTSDNGYLLLKDLYQMSLNAELVVLGSCETGQGVFSKGEGMVSLAYGFDLAGAASTVYSLWAVDEQATIDLMQLFYKNLAKGWDKDKALHEAKIKYLKTANEVSSEPFYWASFVFNGDTKPLSNVQRNSKNNWIFWLAIVLFVSGIFLFFSLKRR